MTLKNEGYGINTNPAIKKLFKIPARITPLGSLYPQIIKKAARLILATILLQSLKKYKDIKEPSLDDKIMANLEAYENELQIEKEN